MVNYIVGIDVSITATGFSLIIDDDNNKLQHYTCRMGTTKKDAEKQNMSRQDRLDHIACSIIDKLDNFIREFWEDDTILFVFENYIMAGKGRHAETAELHGYLKARLSNWCKTTLLEDFWCLEVPPTYLKVFVTGKGRAEKSQVMSDCEHRYGVKFNDDNECDAYCLSQLGKYVLDAPEADLQRKDIFRAITQF